MTLLRARWLLAAAALCAGLAGFWIARELDRGAPQLASGTWFPQAKPVIDFQLTDTSGRAFTRGDLAGAPTLVFFGFTHCPDICPTTLFDVSQVLKKLGPDADRAGALFITVDPERDTPAVLKDYLSNFDPHLRGLTGDQASIDAAIKAYRVYAKKVPLDGGDYTMDHTALVYLMDKDGQFVAPFDTKRSADAAAADLRRYL